MRYDAFTLAHPRLELLLIIRLQHESLGLYPRSKGEKWCKSASHFHLLLSNEQRSHDLIPWSLSSSSPPFLIPQSFNLFPPSPSFRLLFPSLPFPCFSMIFSSLGGPQNHFFSTPLLSLNFPNARPVRRSASSATPRRSSPRRSTSPSTALPSLAGTGASGTRS